ncbi:hypothetical protein FBUS_06810 [Fasciolopsis buskii]|uniref:Uncharacterized protein n=1 Tax=Fasciolopsis buskii TaxID=27845 RepID=A0A8E0VEG8_9TREM|nr:hypothetical protein FBUS_06810 [Fasciolopsis buski]
MSFAIFSKCANSDTEESTDADSPLKPGAELETIFELDENSAHDAGTRKSLPRRECGKPPLGRLRREAPREVATTQQLEFPGIFVEGFRDGHVGFNIPGVMQDSLKPTDSIEVRINLFTPVKHPGFDTSSTEHPYPDCSSRFGSTNGAYDSPHSSRVTKTSDRFGMSWFQDKAPDDLSTDRLNPIGSTNHNMGSSQTNPSLQPSESSFGLGTTENTRNESGSLRTGNRFFSAHLPFGYDSTDSGLHSNGGLVLDPCGPDTSAMSSEYTDLSSRFLRFGIR